MLASVGQGVLRGSDDELGRLVEKEWKEKGKEKEQKCNFFKEIYPGIICVYYCYSQFPYFSNQCLENLFAQTMK